MVGALLLAGTLSTSEIVQAQTDQGVWFMFAAPVGFFIYLVASIAETNRAPFDLPEAESELVAGYMTEYSGFRWALYFLAEYTNMVVVASIATTLFLGGWLRPLTRYRDHFPGTSIELLDAVPTLLMIALAVYCFRLAPKQPVRVQKCVMAAAGAKCLLFAAILLAALFGSGAVRQGVHGAFWFLVKGGRVHLLLHVVPVYVSALPVRPIDAAGLAVFDSAGAGERDRSGCGDRAAGALGLEPFMSLVPTTLATLGCAAWLTAEESDFSEEAEIRRRTAEARRRRMGRGVDGSRERTFLFFCALAVVSAVAGGDAAKHRASAVFLVTTLLATAGIFLQLKAEFLFIVQMILYAGGIMVLFVFVIMLVNLDVQMRAGAVQRAVEGGGSAGARAGAAGADGAVGRADDFSFAGAADRRLRRGIRSCGGRAVQPLYAGVRGRVDSAAGGDDRRGGDGQAERRE